MPEPPGGFGALLKHIATSIRYSQAGIDNKIEGRVFVSFVVNKEGNIETVRLQKGITEPRHEAGAQALNEEALRVVRELPQWTPGRQGGQPVAVSFTIPVSFALK